VRVGRVLLAAVLAWASAACGTLASGLSAPADVPAPSRSDAVPDLDLTLVLRTRPTLRLDLELAFDGSDDGETTFGVSETWGGVGAERTDLVGWRARTLQGERLELQPEGEHGHRVSHDPGARLVVSGTLHANDLLGSFDSQDRYRPVLERDRFHAIGHLLLPLPTHLHWDAACDLSLRYDGFDDAGWAAHSSYGPGEQPVWIRTSLSDLRASLFAGGELDVHTRPLPGGTLTVTLDANDWRFDGDVFADLAADVIARERRFMGDLEAGEYWVSMVSVGPPQPKGLSFGGTGLSDCFALFVQPDLEIALGTKGGLPIRRLLAHECFHEWNGRTIRLADPEEPNYWFSEGFTDYFARAILREAGWLDEQAWLDSLNQTLRDYGTNPHRDLPAEPLGALFWEDGDAQQLPYLRGDLAAMLVDHGIRGRSGGSQDLSVVMTELLAEARNGAGPVTADDLLERFEAHAGPAVVARVRRLVVDGVMPALPQDLVGEAYAVEQALVHEWEPGFDVEGSLEGRRVQGVVRGSAAHDAGLRNGQELAGWSVHRGDAERPIELQVRERGHARTISWYPRGAATEVPRIERVQRSV
jgi:predicted metalloprotease with PDZ domain